MDEDDNTRLFDFGFALAQNDGLTERRAILGDAREMPILFRIKTKKILRFVQDDTDMPVILGGVKNLFHI